MPMGDGPRGQGFAITVLTLRRELNRKHPLLRGGGLRGEIAVVRRQWDEAESAFRRAMTIAQAIGNPTLLWKVRRRFGRARYRYKEGGVGRGGV